MDGGCEGATGVELHGLSYQVSECEKIMVLVARVLKLLQTLNHLTQSTGGRSAIKGTEIMRSVDSRQRLILTRFSSHTPK